MFNLVIIGKLLTLPFKLLKLTIEYFTVGTVFTNDQTNKKLGRVLQAGIMQHMINGLKLPFLRDHAVYKVTDLLSKMSHNYKQFPNYGEMYTTQDDKYPDSVWLAKAANRTPSDPILVYFHGGCFAMPLQDNQLEAMANLYKVLGPGNENLSILIVDYSLTLNGKTYPRQPNECFSVYMKLTKDEGCSNVAVIGDSAGGNLCLSLLYHISQSDLPVWPSAVVPISAWLDLAKAEYSGSFVTNEHLDLFNWEAVTYFGNEYAPLEADGGQIDVNISLNANSFNWSDLPPILNGDILIIFGENEVLKDENLRWCELAGIVKNHPERVIIDPRGYHITFFVSETVAYGTLENWKSQYISEKIIKFLQEKLIR